MDRTNFNYHFNFTSGNFSTTVYNQCNITETSGSRLLIIQNEVEKIQTILSSLPKLKNFTTFINSCNNRYKITLT